MNKDSLPGQNKLSGVNQSDQKADASILEISAPAQAPSIRRARLDPGSLTPNDVVKLQGTLKNSTIARLIAARRAAQMVAPTGVQRLPNVKTKSNPKFEKLLGGVLETSKLRSSHKRGQGSAEQAIYGNDKLVDLAGKVDEEVANTPITTEQIMTMLTLRNFDKIARKDPKKMTDEEKFTVVYANQILSKDIRKGVKINKIIPENQVSQRIGNTMGFNTPEGARVNTSLSLGGSVATEKNYENITGSESVANFGLDYGGYNDQKTGAQKDTYQSPYTAKKGDESFGTVKKVYFIKVDMPDDKVQNLKVPVAQELIDFAQDLIKKSQAFISDSSWRKDESLVELRQKAQEKIAIAQRFLEVAAAGLVSFSRNADGSKNTEDPLNETGMTTKGARVMEVIGPDGVSAEDYRTINQEYYYKGFLNFPESTSIWVKDEKGQDQKLAVLTQVEPPVWNVLLPNLMP